MVSSPGRLGCGEARAERQRTCWPAPLPLHGSPEPLQPPPFILHGQHTWAGLAAQVTVAAEAGGALCEAFVQRKHVLGVARRAAHAAGAALHRHAAAARHVAGAALEALVWLARDRGQRGGAGVEAPGEEARRRGMRAASDARAITLAGGASRSAGIPELGSNQELLAAKQASTASRAFASSITYRRSWCCREGTARAPPPSAPTAGRCRPRGSMAGRPLPAATCQTPGTGWRRPLELAREGRASSRR